MTRDKTNPQMFPHWEPDWPAGLVFTERGLGHLPRLCFARAV